MTGATGATGAAGGADGRRDVFPGLRFDPAPGSREHVHGVAHRLWSAARELDEARTVLRRAHAGTGGWEGSAAGAFTSATNRCAAVLAEGHETLAQAAATLDDWSGRLAALQSAARDREETARAARARFEAATADPDLFLAERPPTVGGDDGPTRETLRLRLDAAVTELRAAHSSLVVATDEGRRLAARHSSAAEESARRLAPADVPTAPPSSWAATGRTLDARQEALDRRARQAAGWAARHGRATTAASGMLTAAATDLTAHTQAAFAHGSLPRAAAIGVLPPPVPPSTGGLAARLTRALARTGPPPGV